MTAQITVNFQGSASETFFVTAPVLDDAENLLLEMLRGQNRPYTSIQTSVAAGE